MRRPSKRPNKAKPRSVRSDGTATRSHVLKVAAKVYAEKGFDRTTSKQICAAAGTNVAAVNYHFGSKDGLYEAVLVEAHGQLVSLDTLEAISRSGGSPESQLRALLAQFIHRAPGSGVTWGLRVLIRELLSPSNHVPALMRQAIQPKIRIVMSIVASVLKRPGDDPLVQRALAFVVLPCVMLAIAPRSVLRQALPILHADPDALLDDMTRYVAAGLESLARKHR